MRVKFCEGLVSETCRTMRLIFLDAAAKSERSKDSSSDFDKRSEYFGPKLTLTGFLALVEDGLSPNPSRGGRGAVCFVG